MKKTPADLIQEATRLTLEGDAAGAAALFQAALSGQQPEKADTVTVVPMDDSGHFLQNSTKTAGMPAASFTDGVYSHHGAELNYKLFIPSRENENPVSLLVMLHGCNQNAHDFATGTRMNDIAQASGMVVLYPKQSTSANPNRCWNWFEPAHQRKDNGEPEALSALTRHIMEDQPINPQQVFVAGFSAGGATALILAEQYPELYAAVGVHSGVPTGAATSNMDALRVMQSASAGHTNSAEHPGQVEGACDIHTPLIVFHGSQDRIVNAANADQIIVNWLAREQTKTVPIHWMPLPLTHTTAEGRHCVVTTYVADERPELTGCEYWQLSQGGHAWSGGKSSAAYTEQGGPDASAEMVRFFLECEAVKHKLPA